MQNHLSIETFTLCSKAAGEAVVVFFNLFLTLWKGILPGRFFSIGKPPTLINQPLVDYPCPYNLGMMEGLVNDHGYRHTGIKSEDTYS